MTLYRRGDFKRALALCLIVGAWLVAVNQGAEILAGRYNVALYVRVLADFATPFTVSSLTAVMRNWGGRRNKVPAG